MVSGKSSRRMKKNILLLESVSAEADGLLNEHAQVRTSDTPNSGPEIAEKETIHAIVTRGKGDVNRKLIDLCPDLEVIARCGVGLDNIDVDYATGKGIRVVNAPGSNADTVAEHALALMLNLQRQLYSSFLAVKRNDWNFRQRYQGDEIRGKTLGILGLGNIGRKVARLATAFGMSVIYWGQAEQPGVDYAFYDLEELLRRSDLISLHLPLVPATEKLINASTLKLMQPHALIVNTSRGGVIDQEALLNALQREQIGGFAADVLDREPPVENDPLLQLDNVLITPHSASLTARTYNEMCLITVRNTLDLLQGKSIDERFIFNRKDL